MFTFTITITGDELAVVQRIVDAVKGEPVLDEKVPEIESKRQRNRYPNHIDEQGISRRIGWKVSGSLLKSAAESIGVSVYRFHNNGHPYVDLRDADKVLDALNDYRAL